MQDPQERAVVTEYYDIPSTSHKLSLQHISLPKPGSKTRTGL